MYRKVDQIRLRLCVCLSTEIGEFFLEKTSLIDIRAACSWAHLCYLWIFVFVGCLAL